MPSVLDQQTSDFLTSLTSGYAWLGGYRISPGSDTWRWTDGSAWGFENWGAGQPNNLKGVQNYLATIGLALQPYFRNLPLCTSCSLRHDITKF